jgi:hypothetical protein
MTAAPTAATVLSHLSLAERRSSIAILQDMTTAEREMARTLLEQVGPAARIDAVALVHDVRQRIVEQAEASKPDAPAWKYAITLMDDSQCEHFRERVADGTDPDEAARVALASGPVRGLGGLGTLRADDDVQPDPDDDVDDVDDDAPKRRRVIPRYRPRERSESVSGLGVGGASGEGNTAPRTRSQPSAQREPFTLGGIAAFDQFGRIGGDPNFRPMRPPWLLSDGETDDDEEATA